MRTRVPENATAARAKAGLAMTVTLVAALVTSAWPARADGTSSTASPATTAAAPTRPADSTAHAATAAKAADSTAHLVIRHAPAAARPASAAPTARAAAKPAAVTAKPAAAAPGTPAAPAKVAATTAKPVTATAKPATATAKTAAPAPRTAATPAAVTTKPAAMAAKPAAPAPGTAMAPAKPVTATVKPAGVPAKTTAATAIAPPRMVPNAMVMPKDTPRPGHTAPVAAAKPAIRPAGPAAPAAMTAPSAPAHPAAPAAGAAPAGGRPTAMTGGKGAPIVTASHGSVVKVTPMVPPPSARPVPGVGTARGTTPIAQIDEHVTYQYNTLGRRDPFQSYIDGSFVGEDVGGDAPIDVGGMKVVGVVWGDSDKFALVEDGRGNGHVLRRGDKVMNGFVEDLKQDGVVVNLTVDGQSQSVTIPLIRKGDKNASR